MIATAYLWRKGKKNAHCVLETKEISIMIPRYHGNMSIYMMKIKVRCITLD